MDDCQYTLVYVYWTRSSDYEPVAEDDKNKQKSDIEKAKNNKDDEVSALH